MKISNEIIEILSEAILEENTLQLSGNLDRATYVKVDKVIKAMGGKWNSKLKKHMFDSKITDIIESVFNTGEILIPQDFGYYPTPNVIVEQMLEIADVKKTDVCLEPSFGKGAILNRLRELSDNVHGVELLQLNYDSIENKNNLILGDFYQYVYDVKFDKIVMNPPFEKGQDAKHIIKAFSMLNQNGILVSVASASVKFRKDTNYAELRKLIDTYGYVKDLPDKSFKESGTNVNTVLIYLKK